MNRPIPSQPHGLAPVAVGVVVHTFAMHLADVDRDFLTGPVVVGSLIA